MFKDSCPTLPAATGSVMMKLKAQVNFITHTDAKLVEEG